VKLRPHPPSPAAPTRTVLVAVLGATPAVLTETIWALAQESPPLIPDTVVVITTTQGASTLLHQLLTPLSAHPAQTIWQALRRRLLGAAEPRSHRLTLEPPIIIRVCDPLSGTTRPLDDIRTPLDNAAAAETILTTVRRFTTDPDTRILGLLSGGRKTMGALLHAALSLAGRRGDRLLHILVTEPFDQPGLTPAFFFPGQPSAKRHRRPDGSSVAHSAARLELADVPLVALGELIFSRTHQAPASFAALTRAASTALFAAQTLTQDVTLHYAPASRQLTLGTHVCTVPNGRPAALCQYLWTRALADDDLLDRVSLAAALQKANATYRRPDGTVSPFTDDDLSNTVNVLRQLLSAATTPPLLIERLLPRRAPIGFNRQGILLQTDQRPRQLRPSSPA